MARVKVDPPPFKGQITDGEGNITPEFHDFLYRLWERTGGDSDVFDFLSKLQTNRVYQQQLEPAVNGSNAAQIFQMLQYRSPVDISTNESVEENVAKLSLSVEALQVFKALQQRTPVDVSRIDKLEEALQVFKALQQRTPVDVSRIDKLEKEAFPAGGIIMWSGVDVPAGWAICDGTNGTPDLRERFVIGSSEKTGFTQGETGGSLTLTFSVTEQPSNITLNKTSAEVQSGTGTTVVGDVSLTDNSHTHGFNDERLPPYYAMAFIMKLAE